jgi:Fe-S oxidoreductase
VYTELPPLLLRLSPDGPKLPGEYGTFAEDRLDPKYSHTRVADRPFITCFNDTLFPQSGRAAVEVLERLGHEVVFPEEQTCCGQMHFNTGYHEEALGADSPLRARVRR